MVYKPCVGIPAWPGRVGGIVSGCMTIATGWRLLLCTFAMKKRNMPLCSKGTGQTIIFRFFKYGQRVVRIVFVLINEKKIIEYEMECRMPYRRGTE